MCKPEDEGEERCCGTCAHEKVSSFEMPCDTCERKDAWKPKPTAQEENCETCGNIDTGECTDCDGDAKQSHWRPKPTAPADEGEEKAWQKDEKIRLLKEDVARLEKHIVGFLNSTAPADEGELPIMTEREIFEHNIKCETVVTPCPDCASLQAKLADREATLNGLQKDHGEELADKDKRIEELEYECLTYQGNFINIEAKLAEKDKALVDKTTDFSDAVAENLKLKKRIEELVAQIELFHLEGGA